MEFHVAQLLREPVGARREYALDQPGFDANGQPAALAGTVRLLRTDAGVLALCSLATRIESACSRCLRPISLPARLEIEEEFYPTIDLATGLPLPPPEEPAAFLIDEHHILDLGEAVRQHLVLAEPMQPLCRPDCAGLCPACGADKNSGVCDCPTVPADVRWAALLDRVRAGGS